MKKELQLKGLLMGAAVVAVASAWAIAPASAEVTEKTPGAIKAVDLVGAWVNAGAPDGAFTYKDMSGNDTDATFKADILPLFTEEGIWGKDKDGNDTASCVSCHSGNTEESLHEMDLTTHAGVLKGADALSAPPGVSILGNSLGMADYNWDHSKLRDRLRNNRMPPTIEFDITEENRDGPCVEGGKVVKPIKYGCEKNAVGLIGEWVAAGAKNDAMFKDQVLPLFTQDNMWHEDSASCASCHSGNTEESLHEMDLTTYEGVLKGADALSSPPGVSILGASSVDGTDYNYDKSKLKHRLRDNRMPPAIEFDITEENRDGPIVAHGKR